MRCPKCGYISFDQIDNCLKCGKNIVKVSVALKGAVPNVAAPEYLLMEEDVVFQGADEFVEGTADDGFMKKEPAVEESGQAFTQQEEEFWFDAAESGEDDGVDIDMNELPSELIKAGKREAVETGKNSVLDEEFDLELDLGDLDLDLDMAEKRSGSLK